MKNEIIKGLKEELASVKEELRKTRDQLAERDTIIEKLLAPSVAIIDPNEMVMHENSIVREKVALHPDLTEESAHKLLWGKNTKVYLALLKRENLWSSVMLVLCACDDRDVLLALIRRKDCTPVMVEKILFPMSERADRSLSRELECETACKPVLTMRVFKSLCDRYAHEIAEHNSSQEILKYYATENNPIEVRLRVLSNKNAGSGVRQMIAGHPSWGREVESYRQHMEYERRHEILT